MSRTDIPPQILGLPLPWSLLDRREFREAIEGHQRTEDSGLEALEVLERAMQATLRDVKEPVPDISEDVSWGLVVRGFLGPISRIDEYHRDLFERVYEMGKQRKGTREEVDSLAANWVRGLAPMVFRRALDWLLPSLSEDPESTVARAYRNLVRERWKTVWEEDSLMLIRFLSVMRHPDTEALIHDIENDPQASPDQKRAVVGVRTKWKEDDHYAANPHIPRY